MPHSSRPFLGDIARTMSTQPAAIAPLGMESNCADSGYWASVRPPCDLDRLQSPRAVRLHARQHDTDRALAEFARQRNSPSIGSL